MSNELAIVEKNWLSLAGQGGDFPVPFEQTIFLDECHIARTMHVDDILIKTKDVAAGTALVLKREPKNEHDKLADQMGMLATVINALAVQDAIIRLGHGAAVFTAQEMTRFAELYTRDRVKVGYVPRRENLILARLMDAGKLLTAKVVQKKLEDHWLNIRIAIDMKDL